MIHIFNPVIYNKQSFITEIQHNIARKAAINTQLEENVNSFKLQ